MNIRSITSEDKEWVKQALINLWGATEMVTRGRIVSLSDLPGFIAEEEGRKVGLVTYKIESKECEIMSLNALTPGKGIGTALIRKIEEIAKENNCSRIVVITTNDNTNALHFYQRRGFFIATIRVNIMPEYRKLKPEIPLIGIDGIAITDEIELQRAI